MVITFVWLVLPVGVTAALYVLNLPAFQQPDVARAGKCIVCVCFVMIRTQLR